MFSIFFDFVSILALTWVILAQHGLQDAFKTPPRPPKTPPRASKTLQRASKMPPRRSKNPQDRPRRLQELPRRLQYAAKISSKTAKTFPRGLQTPNIASKIVQSARKLFQQASSLPGSCQVLASFQNTPEMFVRGGQARWPTVKSVAVNQGWSGGGSPA